MQNPRHFQNVAIIYVLFNNCNDFDSVIALHTRLDTFATKHNILRGFLLNNAYMGVAGVFSGSRIRDAFYFAADIVSSRKPLVPLCTIHLKIGIAVGSIVFNHSLFVGKCVTDAFYLSILCEPDHIAIDSKSLMYMDYDRFSVEQQLGNHSVPLKEPLDSGPLVLLPQLGKPWFPLEEFQSSSIGPFYIIYDLKTDVDEITLFQGNFVPEQRFCQGNFVPEQRFCQGNFVPEQRFCQENFVPISNELKLSVLIIDDSNVINKIMSKKLSSMDICVHTVTSVTNLIEQQHMFYYDAVIIDIYLEPLALAENNVFLPEGLTEAQRIRDCNKDIFICGMTGQEPNTFVVSDIFDLFIFKPWTNAKYKLLEHKLLTKRKTFVIGQID